MSKPNHPDIPPYAIPCWADNVAFYMQIPNPSGEPVTVAFPLGSGGLGRALPFLQGSFANAPRPVVIPAKVNTERSDAAKAVLRRLGMIF